MKKLVKGIALGTLIATILLTILYWFSPSGIILSLAITVGTTCYERYFATE